MMSLCLHQLTIPFTWFALSFSSTQVEQMLLVDMILVPMQQMIVQHSTSVDRGMKYRLVFLLTFKLLFAFSPRQQVHYNDLRVSLILSVQKAHEVRIGRLMDGPVRLQKWSTRWARQSNNI
jgi:hypothetical protein